LLPKEQEFFRKRKTAKKKKESEYKVAFRLIQGAKNEMRFPASNKAILHFSVLRGFFFASPGWKFHSGFFMQK
jgi:hypothetical protein